MAGGGEIPPTMGCTLGGFYTSARCEEGWFKTMYINHDVIFLFTACAQNSVQALATDHIKTILFL